MPLRDLIIVGTYVYARETNIPQPNLEGVIAQNGEASYLYALKVLRGRFKKGEPSISESPLWSVKYARFVIRKRFILAEEKIARSPEHGYEYFRHVMGGKRLPEKMHCSMLLLSFEDPENAHIKRYFSEVG